MKDILFILCKSTYLDSKYVTNTHWINILYFVNILSLSVRIFSSRDRNTKDFSDLFLKMKLGREKHQ